MFAWANWTGIHEQIDGAHDTSQAFLAGSISSARSAIARAIKHDPSERTERRLPECGSERSRSKLRDPSAARCTRGAEEIRYKFRDSRRSRWASSAARARDRQPHGHTEGRQREASSGRRIGAGNKYEDLTAS